MALQTNASQSAIAGVAVTQLASSDH